jgi:hypothetical protein
LDKIESKKKELDNEYKELMRKENEVNEKTS